MNPEPRLVPLLVPTLMVTTLGSTFLTAPASESGGRCAAGAGLAPPPVPTTPRWAKTYPSVPPSPPASSAVTIATRNTRPSPRRAGTAVTGSGSGPASPDPGVGWTTTAAGDAGSRHGSCSASDHQTSWRRRQPEPSVTIGTPHFVMYQDCTLPQVPPGSPSARCASLGNRPSGPTLLPVATAQAIEFTEAYLPEDRTMQVARSLAQEVGLAPVPPGTGAALRLLAAAGGARAVVEIGTGTGVSGLWLLGGMRPRSEEHTS